MIFFTVYSLKWHQNGVNTPVKFSQRKPCSIGSWFKARNQEQLYQKPPGPSLGDKGVGGGGRQYYVPKKIIFSPFYKKTKFYGKCKFCMKKVTPLHLERLKKWPRQKWRWWRYCEVSPLFHFADLHRIVKKYANRKFNLF